MTLIEDRSDDDKQEIGFDAAMIAEAYKRGYAQGIEDAATCCEDYKPKGWDIPATSEQTKIAFAIRSLKPNEEKNGKV